MSPEVHTPARIAVVDDNEVVRSGIKVMLTGERDLHIVGEAADGQEAVELCRHTKPDLVLMDVRMPRMDGLSATWAIKREFPGIAILILTMHENEDYLLEAIRAGASGYVLKDASQPELATSIRRVLEGETTLDPGLATRLLCRLANEGREAGDSSSARRHAELLQPLTPREIEVLKLLALGRTNRQIAHEFVLSTGTVKIHVEHIIAKLGVSDRTQAVVRALESRIISFP
jgi:DNA-binding NarL/FixJ family response regulator